jgi:SAM-dependent methyltransferase
MKPTDWWDVRLKDKAAFNFFVKNLGEASSPSRVLAHELAREAGVTSVLDVGCGPAIDRWDGTGIAWTGCDPSHLLGEFNAKRGVSIDHAPAHLLPYGPDAFDLVYSRHVWEHLPHYLPALKEACRVAKRAVMVTFFRPPGSHEEMRVTDGAHYNDYRLIDMLGAFRAAWPACNVTMRKLAPQRFLPSGESILLVTRASM